MNHNFYYWEYDEYLPYISLKNSDKVKTRQKQFDVIIFYHYLFLDVLDLEKKIMRSFTVLKKYVYHDM